MPGLFSILASKPGMTVIITLKEIQRVYGIYGGVIETSKEYHTHYLLYFVVGFVRGE